MAGNGTKVNQFDEWLKDGSAAAALVMRQWLVPVEGEDAVIFPPTYARPERMREEDWLGYNIDRFEDGSSVCQIDSLGSQANRMEPIFKRDKYKALVPRVVIKAGDNEVDLLDAGHRAADAIVRYSDLEGELEQAFEAYRDEGNAQPLAKLAPTSFVFGAWDSRDTQTKLPRIVRSVVRAFDVKRLHRSAQYIPPLEYVEEGLLDAPQDKKGRDAMSQLGLSHAPASWTHGGVQAREIRRETTLNFAALRCLGAEAEEDALMLRRYILGLALVAFTAPQETFLREGCQLVPDPDRPAVWNLVRHDGQRESSPLYHEQVLEFAELAAEEFGVGAEKTATFDAAKAKKALGQTKDERKKARRSRGKNAQKKE